MEVFSSAEALGSFSEAAGLGTSVRMSRKVVTNLLVSK